MRINTYSGLIEAVPKYIGRDDSEIKERMDDFIILVESEVNQRLRVRDNLCWSDGNISTETRFMPLPCNYLEMKQIFLIVQGEQSKIDHVHPDAINVKSYVDTPSCYTIGSCIELDCVGCEAYKISMNYYAEISPLSATNDSNWLTIKHPSVYLEGLKWAANSFIENTDMADRSLSKMIALIEHLNGVDIAGSIGTAPQVKIQGGEIDSVW